MIAIFGGTGEIGSQLTLHLRNSGHDVKIFSRGYAGPLMGRMNNLEFNDTPVSDVNRLADALRGCDVVINGIIVKNGKSPAEIIRMNDRIVANLLKASKLAGVKQFIHFSSIVSMPPTITSEVLSKPFGFSKEKDWYTKAKILNEKTVLRLGQPMKCTIVRPAIVYGPMITWSNLACMRSAKSSIVLPKGDSYCHAIYIGDLIRLVEELIGKKNPPKLVYGANPEPTTWKDFYKEHAEAIGINFESLELESSDFNRLTSGKADMGSVLNWVADSPLTPRLSKNRFLLFVARKFVKLANRSVKIDTSTNTRQLFVPNEYEAKMYMSNTPIQQGKGVGTFSFRYATSLKEGARKAAEWYLAHNDFDTQQERKHIEKLINLKNTSL